MKCDSCGKSMRKGLVIWQDMSRSAIYYCYDCEIYQLEEWEETEDDD